VTQNDAQICAQRTFKFRFFPLSAVAQCFARSSTFTFIIGIAFVSFFVVNEVTHARFFRFTFVLVLLVQGFFVVL
jgi:ABC-type polysaccharide/polyol phosphate export permease